MSHDHNSRTRRIPLAGLVIFMTCINGGCSWSKQFFRQSPPQPVDPAFVMDETDDGGEFSIASGGSAASSAANLTVSDVSAANELSPPQISLTGGPTAIPTPPTNSIPPANSTQQATPAASANGSPYNPSNSLSNSAFGQSAANPAQSYQQESYTGRADGLTYGQARKLAASLSPTQQPNAQQPFPQQGAAQQPPARSFDGSFTDVFDNQPQAQPRTGTLPAVPRYPSGWQPSSNRGPRPPAGGRAGNTSANASYSGTGTSPQNYAGSSNNRYRQSAPGQPSSTALSTAALSTPALGAVAPSSPPRYATQQPMPPAPPSQPTLPAHVRIQVTGVSPGKGPVRIALFESPQTFPQQDLAAAKKALQPTNTTIETTLPVSPNLAAVAVYQDMNRDGKLNRSRFGVPTEPYGFSGGARGRRGPPKFAEAASKMPAGSVQQIQLR